MHRGYPLYTNAYRFKLITCIVPYDFQQGNSIETYNLKSITMNTTGQPIAWCIADQETTEIVELFLQSIRKRSPMSAVSVLMTDDGIRYSIIMNVYYKLQFFPLYRQHWLECSNSCIWIHTQVFTLSLACTQVCPVQTVLVKGITTLF